MKVKLISISLVFVICCIGNLKSQDIASDFTRVNNKYNSLTKFSVDVVYSVIDAANNQVVESITGCIKKNGKTTYRRDGEVESVTSDKYSLIVDSHNKKIMFGPVTGEIKKQKDLSVSYMTELLKICSATKRNVLESNIVEYTLYFNNITYEKVVVKIDTQSYFISELIFYSHSNANSNEGSFITKISYSNFNENPKFSGDEVTYKTFIIKSFNKYYVNEKYKSYEFINMMESGSID